MLKIDTGFNPFRLKLIRKEPVSLKVSVRNMNDEDTLVSYDVILARALSLDKGGFKTKETIRIGSMEPGQRNEKYFQIFAKAIAQEGSYPLMVRATEHHNNYSLVKKEYKKNLELKIE